MKLFAMGLDQNERSTTTFIDVPMHKVSETESISAKQDAIEWRLGPRKQGDPLTGGPFEMHFASGAHFVGVMAGNNLIQNQAGGGWRLSAGEFLFVAPGALHHSTNPSLVPLVMFNILLPGDANVRDYKFR